MMDDWEEKIQIIQGLVAPLAPLNPLTTAIIVVDPQYDYISPEGNGAKLLGWDVGPMLDAVGKTGIFLDEVRGFFSPQNIIWTKFIGDDVTKYPAGFVRYKQSKTLVQDGTRGSEFYGINPAAGEPVFEKPIFSAFSNPDFDAHLKARGIDTLIWTIGLTSRCIQASVIMASHFGYRNILPDGLVANPGNLAMEGRMAMLEMRRFYAYAMKPEDIAAQLRYSDFLPVPKASHPTPP